MLTRAFLLIAIFNKSFTAGKGVIAMDDRKGNAKFIHSNKAEPRIIYSNWEFDALQQTLDEIRNYINKKSKEQILPSIYFSIKDASDPGHILYYKNEIKK